MTAYFEEEDAQSFDEAPPIEVGVVMNWAGALVSLLLMVGLGAWGYQLLMRDVTGVPVVRALEGPMRIAPQDPGGEQADYQGLSVTQVAVEGAEERPAERVVLAPPPVALAEEDVPMAALIPDTPSAPEGAAGAPKSAIELALAEALGQSVETLAGTEVDGGPPGSGATVTEQGRVRIIPASVAGVAESPRPVARPADFVDVVAASAAPAPAFALEGPEVAAADIPPGTRLVQLGAFPSVEAAREAWTELETRFGAYLDGKKRVVQEASAGGSTFYRLRAMGFDDLADTRRFCAVLVAESANCIPVIRR